MKYEWLDAYLLDKPHAVKEWQEDWQVNKFMVGGKMFAMWGGDKTGKEIITLKLEPARGEFLRNQYEDIIPGYYMNKLHWNSLYL